MDVLAGSTDTVQASDRNISSVSLSLSQSLSRPDITTLADRV